MADPAMHHVAAGTMVSTDAFQIQKQLTALTLQLQILVGVGGTPREVRENALRDAASQGDAPAIERLLASKDVRVDAVAANSWVTALHIAAWAGHADAVEMLIAGGASCDAALRSNIMNGENPCSVLEHAVEGGSLRAVSLVLADSTSTLMSKREKMRLLHHAADAFKKDSVEIFKALAKSTAFSEVREDAGDYLVSALTQATFRGNMKIVHEILAFAPALEQRFSFDLRWSGVAAALERGSAESVKQLLGITYCAPPDDEQALEKARERFGIKHFSKLMTLACTERRRIKPDKSERARLVQMVFEDMVPAPRVFSLSERKQVGNESIALTCDPSGAEHFRLKMGDSTALTAKNLASSIQQALPQFRMIMTPRLRLFEGGRELNTDDDERINNVNEVTVQVETGVDLQGLGPDAASALRIAVQEGDIRRVLSLSRPFA